MDAFELLKKDHKNVSNLFSEIESASGQEKLKVFGRLKAELDLHAHVEETVLYPALENIDEAREITLEAYEEHKVVKDLLGELANAGAPDDEWNAKLTVLKENVEHHVEEEEGELFSKAREALGQARIEQLGTELEAEKVRQTGGNVETRPTRETEPSAPAKARTAKKESPGVLQRIANLVGLGGSRSSGSAKKPATRSGKTSAAQSKLRSASKTKSASKAGGKKAATRAKAAKPAAKAAVKKSASTPRSANKASRSRSSSKATKSSGKKKASNVSRTSATKTASRGASNQKVKAASKKGRASKSSTKRRSKSR